LKWLRPSPFNSCTLQQHQSVGSFGFEGPEVAVVDSGGRLSCYCHSFVPSALKMKPPFLGDVDKG
jgi:hypothetical protein